LGVSSTAFATASAAFETQATSRSRGSSRTALQASFPLGSCVSATSTRIVPWSKTATVLDQVPPAALPAAGSVWPRTYLRLSRAGAEEEGRRARFARAPVEKDVLTPGGPRRPHFQCAGAPCRRYRLSGR